MIFCIWCNQNEAKYQLVVYNLEKQREIVANKRDKSIQYLRSSTYCAVHLCSSCLPVKKQNDYQEEINEQSKKQKEKRTIT